MELPTQPEGVAWPAGEWPRADVGANGDVAELNRLIDRAFAGPPELGQTRAVLVIHEGRIVAERYAAGLDATTTHRSWSMAKSWLHAMVGILVRQGRLDIHAPAEVPEWADANDPRGAITLDQLLRMRSGLHFVEEYVEGGGEASVTDMIYGAGKDDVAGYAARCRLAHEPGAVFYYSSGTSNIVARIAQQAADAHGPRWTEFMRRELFEPLGAASPTPKFDGAGTWIGSSYLFATAQDFARLGLLYLRGGMWNGRRILPQGWADYARTESGRDAEGKRYGAHFWLVPGDPDAFQCQGFEGQRTTIVPALDLIVVRLGRTKPEGTPYLNTFMSDVIACFRASGR